MTALASSSSSFFSLSKVVASAAAALPSSMEDPFDQVVDLTKGVPAEALAVGVGAIVGVGLFAVLMMAFSSKKKARNALYEENRRSHEPPRLHANANDMVFVRPPTSQQPTSQRTTSQPTSQPPPHVHRQAPLANAAKDVIIPRAPSPRPAAGSPSAPPGFQPSSALSARVFAKMGMSFEQEEAQEALDSSELCVVGGTEVMKRVDVTNATNAAKAANANANANATRVNANVTEVARLVQVAPNAGTATQPAHGTQPAHPTAHAPVYAPVYGESLGVSASNERRDANHRGVCAAERGDRDVERTRDAERTAAPVAAGDRDAERTGIWVGGPLRAAQPINSHAIEQDANDEAVMRSQAPTTNAHQHTTHAHQQAPTTAHQHTQASQAHQAHASQALPQHQLQAHQQEAHASQALPQHQLHGYGAPIRPMPIVDVAAGASPISVPAPLPTVPAPLASVECVFEDCPPSSSSLETQPASVVRMEAAAGIIAASSASIPTVTAAAAAAPAAHAGASISQLDLDDAPTQLREPAFEEPPQPWRRNTPPKIRKVDPALSREDEAQQLLQLQHQRGMLPKRASYLSFPQLPVPVRSQLPPVSPPPFPAAAAQQQQTPQTPQTEPISRPF